MANHDEPKISDGQAACSSRAAADRRSVGGGGCNRERMERHWEEVAGRVTVPEEWGHEGVLDEWVDCSTFDELLAPHGVVSARRALVRDQGGRRGCRRSADPMPPQPAAPLASLDADPCRRRRLGV
ncbi:unnamed protein product [Linum tenue]|uniref:Uncharacterized protein n=1 Tax=Linum tenue TaxID=586396 RepID=A0AAV0QJ49_9ROSI|nr:unnamed protein product [Linum tenue]